MQSIECSPLQVAPLRIYKNVNKPNLLRNDSTSSAESSFSNSTTTSIEPALSASSSSSSTASSSTSIQHNFGPPLNHLLKARQRHRKRHNSWQISARLAVRAQQAYESAVSGRRETIEASQVDEARIRLRIALEEEDKCRKKVDDAALEIMKLKRINEERVRIQQKQQIEDLASINTGLCSPAFSSSSSSFGDSSPVLPLTPTMPAMTFDLGQYYDEEPDEEEEEEGEEQVDAGEKLETHRYSIHLKEVRRLTRMPAKLVHCSCGAACLCSAVSLLLE